MMVLGDMQKFFKSIEAPFRCINKRSVLFTDEKLFRCGNTSESTRNMRVWCDMDKTKEEKSVFSILPTETE